MMGRWLMVVALSVGCGGKKGPEPAATEAMSEISSVGMSVDDRIARAAAWLTTNQAEDAQRALDDLSSLLIEEPERVEIPFNMALAYHQLGDFLNARKFYLRTTAIDSSVGAAWLNLGALAEQGGQYKRALQHYRAGLQNDPDKGELVVGIIGILRRLGQHDEAIEEAKAALSRDANNIDVYNNLGLVYIDMNKPDLAQFIYQKALNSIDGAENNPALHANLGRTYLAKDRRWNAKQELEKARAKVRAVCAESKQAAETTRTELEAKEKAVAALRSSLTERDERLQNHVGTRKNAGAHATRVVYKLRDVGRGAHAVAIAVTAATTT